MAEEADGEPSGQGNEGRSSRNEGEKPEAREGIAAEDITGAGTRTFSGGLAGLQADSGPNTGYFRNDPAGRWQEDSRTLRDQDWKHGRGYEPTGDEGTYDGHLGASGGRAAAGMGEAPEDVGAGPGSKMGEEEPAPVDEVTRAMQEAFRDVRFPATKAGLIRESPERLPGDVLPKADLRGALAGLEDELFEDVDKLVSSLLASRPYGLWIRDRS